MIDRRLLDEAVRRVLRRPGMGPLYDTCVMRVYNEYGLRWAAEQIELQICAEYRRIEAEQHRLVLRWPADQECVLPERA